MGEYSQYELLAYEDSRGTVEIELRPGRLEHPLLSWEYRQDVLSLPIDQHL